MLDKFLQPIFLFSEQLQLFLKAKLQAVPYIDRVIGLPVSQFTILLAVISAVLVFLLLFLLVQLFRSLRKSSTKKAVKKFFAISDLSKFKVRKMGKVGSKNYLEDGMNSFKLALPHWKHANDDGSKAKKAFNKVIWEESVLWLHAGRKVYVLTTKDPWDMLYLVHSLRESGLDITPCQQEFDKQERMDHEKRSCDEVLSEFIEKMDENKLAFVDLCRQRLCLRGYNISDAPKNAFGIDLFYKRNGQANIIKCLLTPRNYLTGLDEMKSFKDATREFFAESCTLITTGHITVAAAGFAREHKVDVICNERLVELLTEDKVIPADKAYLRWELKEDDVKNLMPDDLKKEIFK